MREYKKQSLTMNSLWEKITDNIHYRFFKICVISFFLLTPVFFGIGIVLKYGVNVPFLDEFDSLVPLFSEEGSISLKTLFSQHNEHRIFFPRIVFIMIGRLSQMNMKVYMLVSQMLVAVIYFALCTFINNIDKGKIKYPMMLLIGFLLYSPVQYANQLLGFQVGFYMVDVFAVLSIFFMHKSVNTGEKDLRFLILSILCAIVSSFSSIQGLLVWFAVDFVYVLHYRKNVLKSMRFRIWNLFTVSSWVLYFLNYHKPGNVPSLLSILKNPKESIQYVLCIVGHPLFIDRYSLYVYGLLTIIVCLIILFIFIKHNDKSDFMSISLIVFGSLVAVSITVGRVGFGVWQALSSRYTTFTLNIVIGSCLFIFNKRLSFSASKTIITIVVLSLVISSVSLLKNGIIPLRDWRKYDMTILLDYKNRWDEELVRLHPNATTVIRLAKIMEQQRIGPFKSLDKIKDNKAPLDMIPIVNIPIPQDITSILLNDISSIIKSDDILTLYCGTHDPFICFPLQEPIDKSSDETLYIEIKYSSSIAGKFQFFYDFGNGYSETNSFRTRLDIISEKSTLCVPVINWQEGTKLVSVRIDPPDGTKFELESIWLYGNY
jgi:hypothetical protein